jgi:hypothetical protein
MPAGVARAFVGGRSLAPADRQISADIGMANAGALAPRPSILIDS